MKRVVRRVVAALGLLAVAGLLWACGQQPTTGGQPAGGDQGATLRVQDEQGNDAVVDLEKGPVLFVAYWCPHCEHFLASATAMGVDKLPTVVSIWPQAGDSLEDVVRETNAKLARTGWEGTPFFVLMGDVPDYVKGTPTLAWWDGKEVNAANPLEMQPEELAKVIGAK